MKNNFKTSKCAIIAILTFCLLFCISGTQVFAAMAETTEDTPAAVEDITQELMSMMARSCGPTSVNQMQHLITSGQAPSSIVAVHNGFQGQQPHVHFSDGTAMNFDGSAHHGNPNPSAATMSWLNSHGWCG